MADGSFRHSENTFSLYSRSSEPGIQNVLIKKAQRGTAMLDHDFRSRVRAALNAIQTSQTEHDLLGSLDQVASAFGADFGHASLRYGRQHSDKPIIFLTTHAPEAVDAYMAERAYDSDPVAAHLISRTTVASSEELDWTSPKARQVMRLKRDFGVGPSGLCVSVFGPCGEWGMITLSARTSPAPWAPAIAETRCMFSRIGTLFFEQMRQLGAGQTERSILSRRETEALTWTARGKTISETATILALSSSTVRHLLDKARAKLDAATKSEAVAKALTRRMITLH
jgi:DNA-binding CsgD family transcriptional regulator